MIELSWVFIYNLIMNLARFPKIMKSKLIHILVFSVLLLLISSCGKEKKPEFVDDQQKSTEQQNTEQKSSEQKKEEDLKQQANDSNVLKMEDLSDPKKRKEIADRKTPIATISPLEADKYHGKLVTVKGFVADIYQSEKVAYLNFVEKYPDNPFTAVIFASKFADFPDIGKYKNKNVEVSGYISQFKGKPQIILNDPKQIKTY